MSGQTETKRAAKQRLLLINHGGAGLIGGLHIPRCSAGARLQHPNKSNIIECSSALFVSLKPVLGPANGLSVDYVSRVTPKSFVCSACCMGAAAGV